MNENLQQAVASLITKALEGVDTTVGFLNAELPDYIYQLLLWYGIYNFMVFLVSIGFIILHAYVIKQVFTIKNDKNEVFFKSHENDVIPKQWIVLMLSIVMGMSTMISLITFNLIWLQIWIAPKVWLIEYAGNLVK
jgi:hypothetical protein